jgi:hypothetical protein
MSIRRWGTIVTTPGLLYIPEVLKSLELLTKPAGGAAIQAGTGAIIPGSFVYQITAAGATQYYWQPAKLGKVDTSLGAATTTTFFSRNFPFVAGDAITVGANSGVVASVDPNSGLITMTAALAGIPVNGDRVFSQTAAQNSIRAVALDYAPLLSNSDQAIEIAIAGVFKKDVFDLMYAAADITTWGAVSFPEVNAYRWS